MPLSLGKQLNLKLKLEKTFRPMVRSIFNSMLQDFRTSVAANGFPIDADLYLPVWLSAIDRQYRRVQKAFTNVIEEPKHFLSYETKQDEEEDKELLALALLTWRKDNASRQAGFITQTNAKDMRDAIRIARQDLASEGITIPTNRELALSATAVLKRKFNKRVESILMSETQGPAESTKFSQAEISAGLRPTVLGGVAVATTAKKKWHDVGDERVRKEPFNHRGSTIKEVAINEPFIVSGERLMFPGDSSMGASLGNLINCRCGSSFSI